MKMLFAFMLLFVALAGCNAPTGGDDLAATSLQAHSNGGSSPNAPAGMVGGNGTGGTIGSGGPLGVGPGPAGTNAGPSLDDDSRF